MPPIVAKILLVFRITVSVFPIVVMIGLVPLIQNDFVLVGIYTLFILMTFWMRQDKKDLAFLALGFITSTIGELFFISTGAEVFRRDVLIFGMPIWLPFLWGYVFIMIRRSVVALERYMR